MLIAGDALKDRDVGKDAEADRAEPDQHPGQYFQIRVGRGVLEQEGGREEAHQGGYHRDQRHPFGERKGAAPTEPQQRDLGEDAETHQTQPHHRPTRRDPVGRPIRTGGRQDQGQAPAKVDGTEDSHDQRPYPALPGLIGVGNLADQADHEHDQCGADQRLSGK